MESKRTAERLAEFEALCRRQGVALTVQRRLIFETVLGRNDHPTADQVAEVVRERIPGLSRTTVYRVLDALVDLGVIRRLHHPGSSARYDAGMHRHHHLVCNKCHKVIDLESRKLDRIALPDVSAEGFTIEDFSVHFMGLCAECGGNRPQ